AILLLMILTSNGVSILLIATSVLSTCIISSTLLEPQILHLVTVSRFEVEIIQRRMRDVIMVSKKLRGQVKIRCIDLFPMMPSITRGNQSK
uniref:PIG-H domain-containing protein n=1 Tax=Haemonchus contortus TaxID=6289 RepID=A0A7I5EB18_HAECO